jgi:glycosyltransferase involved in cell wall biosynthesis
LHAVRHNRFMSQIVQLATRARGETERLRVAVVCDFAEERWPSMDLVGEMVVENLRKHAAQRLEVSRICPPFTRGLSRIARLGEGSAAFNADRALNRLWFYPRFIGKLHQQFDVFHIVDHSYSHLINHLPAGRTVVSCHDLDTFRCLLEPAQEPRSRAFRAMTRRILRGFRRAARIVCDSIFTRDEILRYGLVSAERLDVVPNGVAPVFTPTPGRAAETEANRILGHGRFDTVNLLHVGSVIPRKRIDVLLRTFAGVHRAMPETRLLRVGGPFTRAQSALADSLGISDAISVLPHLAPEVLAAVYRRAALVLLPSEAEGFGLPVVEAMACATPVVASDLSVLREVGGDAAEYCPVGDIETWSAVVVGLLRERIEHPDNWNRLRRRSLAQAAKFTWAKYVERVHRIYSELAG